VQGWQRAKQVFQEALELSPAERPGYVARACGGDSDLQREVESLLTELAAAGNFMEAPAAEWMGLSNLEARSEHTEPRLQPGAEVGPYQVRALLGRGGMGEVYRAWDPRLGREVALKVLLPEVAGDEESIRRFEQEARAASALNHPAILTVHDIGRAGPMLYIVTELVQGHTLRELIRLGPLSLPTLLIVGSQVAAGLAKAHARGVVHRDLKPENVMLTEDLFVRILDFGLAKLQRSEPEAPGHSTFRAGRLMGTLGYMSPEQARGEPVDFRSDQFALGVMLYELASGKPAFPRGSIAESLAATLHQQPVPLAQLRPSLPAALLKVVDRCLAKDPADRYPSTDEPAQELMRLRVRTAEIEAIKHGPATVQLPPPRSGRRRWLWLAAAATALVLAAAGLGWGLLRDSAPTSIATARGPRPAPLSLAVLPFKTLDPGGNGEDAYLGVGMADALITQFARTRRMLVRPTSAVRIYTKPGQDPVEIGRELGVEVVLDGHLQRADRLRLTMQLLRVRDGALLWADKLDAPLTGILSLQDSIADKVMRVLPVSLTGDESKRLMLRATENDEAFRSYLKGRYYWNQRTEQSVNKALEFFKEALNADPSFAQAWAGMSDAYIVLTPFTIPLRKALPLAKAAVQKALELDDSLAEAHASLAHVQTYLWEWAEAERAYKRAIELHPGYATAHHWYAWHLMALGRTDEALASMQAAHDADPLSKMISADTGQVYYFAGQPQRALDHCRKELAMDAAFPHTHRCLALALQALGRHEEAIAAFEKVEALGSPQREALAHAYGLAGQTRKARQLLAGLTQPTDAYVSPYGIARVYTALQERDQALASLEAAYQVNDGELLMVAVDPAFTPLHSDPRFTTLLRKMGLKPSPTAK
jgi:TolB-like protein/Tfp pilus assembly protein PilF